MSIEIMNRVWTKSRQKGTARLVMLAISDNANDLGLAWPGISGKLAEKTLLTARTVGQRIQFIASCSRELCVFPNTGTSHDYIITVGMSISQFREAMKALAAKRRMSISELIRVRRIFAGKMPSEPPKEFRTPSEEPSGVPPKTDSDHLRKSPTKNHQEPPKDSLNHHESSAPKGGGQPPASDSMFEILLKEIFGVTYRSGMPLSKDLRGRVNLAKKVLADSDITDPQEVVQFFTQYRKDNPDISPPRDPVKIALGILALREQPVADLDSRSLYERYGLPADYELAEPQPPREPLPGENIWQTAYGDLQLQLPRETFDSWLRWSAFLGREGDTFRIGVDRIEAREWLEQRLKNVVVGVLRRITQEEVDVEFVLVEPVDEEPAYDAPSGG